MLTREERRMVAAITIAAMAVSVASAVSIVRNLKTPREETHIYLPQTADTALSQSYRSPVCTPLVIQCGGGTGRADRADAAESGTVVSDPVLLDIAEIPLSGELQEVMQDACAAYDVPYALALAVCEAESSFQADADNGVCWGYMQINPVNYERLRSLGIEPTTYAGNIEAGVYMLGELLDAYGDTHKALMAYNCGDAGAARMWEMGYDTSGYSQNVVEKSNAWQKIILENIVGGKNHVGN